MTEYNHWKVMAMIETAYEAEGISETSFTEFVMKRLHCPSYQDAELCVANYYHAKKRLF